VKRIALLLLLASSAFADDFVTVPRVLTNLTRATIYWDGSDSLSHTPLVTVDGLRVNLEFGQGSCVINQCFSFGSVELPALPAGTYQFVWTKDGDDVVLERTVEVYDVTTLPFFPAGMPTGDRYLVRVEPDFADMDLYIPAQANEPVSSWHTGYGFFPPARAQDGAVDVRYEAFNAREFRGVARNAFVYTAGDPCRDERIWESVLVPIDYNGKGAHGSEWVTEVRTSGASFVPAHCENSSPQYSYPSHTSGPYYIRVPRTGAHRVRHNVRVRETSGRSLPVDIPVLREGEWLHDATTIELPPPSPNRRVTLRLYAPDDAVSSVSVGAAKTTLVRLQNLGPDAPRYATLDLAGFSGTLYLTPNARDFIRARYWALVTMTDNETQQVFVYPAPKAR